MNTEKRNSLLECRSADAGDRSRFIDADDIGEWFAKMMICEIRTWFSYYNNGDIMINDLANDWEKIIKFVCRPTTNELKSLRKFWSQKLDHSGGEPMRNMRKIWFNMADAGEVAKRKINPELQAEWMEGSEQMNSWVGDGIARREMTIFKNLIISDKGYFVCEMRRTTRPYETWGLAPYFQRMATELSGLRVVITAHYGWFYFRGQVLKCFGWDDEKKWGTEDYIHKYLREIVCGLPTGFERKYKIWENALFKKRFMIKIKNACVKALWNPHTPIGKWKANKLYDENFAE